VEREPGAAGKALAKVLADDPEAAKATEEAMRQIKARAPEHVQAINEGRNRLINYLAEAGIDMPEDFDIEELVHLARVVKMPKAVFLSGKWTAVDLLAMAEEWAAEERAKIERERLREKFREEAGLSPEQRINAMLEKCLFPEGTPDNERAVGLAKKLYEEKQKDKKDRRPNNDIAREFTGESKDDFPKASSLINTICRWKRDKQVNL